MLISIASVAKLIRWKAKTIAISEEIIFVRVGDISTEKFWWKTYTTAQLEEIGKSNTVEIFRTSDSQICYSYARWIINDDGIVIGVHLEAKEKTSENANICDCYFTQSPFVLKEVDVISEAGLPCHIPKGTYTLPQEKRVGPELSETQKRADRSKQFKTYGMNLKIAGSPVQANPEGSHKFDLFQGKLNFVNVNKNKQQIVVTKVSCLYRLIGSQEWKSVDTLKMKDTFTLFPYESLAVPYTLTINDPTKSENWLRRAWIARNQPIRFKFIITDVEGATATRIIEEIIIIDDSLLTKQYVYKPDAHAKPRPDETLFLYVDNFETLHRTSAPCKVGDPTSSSVVQIASRYHDVKDLQQLAYRAKLNNQFQVLMDERTIDSDRLASVHIKYWGLVDPNTLRVYAIKVLLRNAHSAHLGYLAIPLYGPERKFAQTVDIAPVVESDDFPNVSDLETLQIEDYPQDDHFDDVTENTELLGAPINPSSVITLEESTIKNLQRLNQNIDRITSSMSDFESIEKSINSLGQSIAIIVDCMSK